MADLALNITARNQAQAVLNSLGSGLEQVAAQAKTAQQSLKAMGDGMVSAGTKLTAGVTAPILGFAAAAIKGAAEQEQLEVSFTTMLGSAEKAKTMMADLSAFAASTPFESPEIQNASKMLLAFGVDAEQIIPTMTNLGDIAAGLNIPIGDMAYLFGTTKAAGRMMTADLNQFTSRGIPMIAALAETMGIAESEVKAAVEAGKVGFPEMEAALQSLTAEGGQFSGLMAAQSMTLAGLFSTLSDNVGLSLAEIGKVIIETFDLKTKLAGAIEWLVKAKDAMFAFAKSNPQMFKLGIIIAAVAAAIGPLLIGLGMLVGWMSAAMPVIAAVGAAFGLLLSPIALVVAAIAGLGAALVYFDVGGIGTALRVVKNAAIDLFSAFQQGELFTFWEDGSSALGDFAQALGMSEETATALGMAFYDIKGAFAEGGFAEAFKVWEDGSSYVGEFAIALGVSEDTVMKYGMALYTIKAAFAGLVTAFQAGELFTFWEDGSSHIGDFAEALGVSEDAVMAVGLAIYSLKEAFAGTDFTTLQTSVSDAFSSIGTSISDYFSGEISLGGLATVVSDGFVKIKDSVVAFFGGADFSQFLTAIKWSEFIEKLSWENIVSKLSDWGAWIASLDWTAIITTVIDWATYIPAMKWNHFVTIIDWATYIVSFVWSEWISKITWKDFIAALDWLTYIATFTWDSFIAKIEWPTFVKTLTWSDVITELTEWGTWITSLDWTKIITTVIDWATWIPALTWSGFITAMEWGTYVLALTWSGFITALDWATYIISTLTWADFVAALDWATYILAFTWESFITKLDWTGALPKLETWGTYITAIDWTKVITTALDWATYIPALTWNALIAVIDWAVYLDTLDWSTSVTSMTDWGAYIVSLEWGTYITGALAWSSYVAEITWGNFVEKLNWPAGLKNFTWSSYLEKLGWTSFVTALGEWSTYVPTLSWSEFVTALSDWGTYVTALAWSSFVTAVSLLSYVSTLDWYSFVSSVDLADYIPDFGSWYDYIKSYFGGMGTGTPASTSSGDSSGAPTSTMPDTSGSWFGLPGNDGKSRGGLLGARPEMAGTSAGGGGMTIIINVSDNSLSDTRKLARELAFEVATEIRRKGF